jgi:hypothetical protein
MSVDFAAGVIVSNQVAVAVIAGKVVVTAAHATLPRLDLASVSNAGVKVITAGTAATDPLPPTIPQSGGVNNIVCAMIYVPAADTAINTNQITDKRMFVGRLDVRLRVTADVINATTSFADITGLTCPVEAGKHYNFVAHLYHLANATTTGAQFGINGPAMTGLRLQSLDVKTASAATAVMASNAADVTTLDTAAIVELDSSTTPALAILSGWFNPSAAGTFAVRSKSEVAIAAGLTVQRGSWCSVWEAGT